MINKANTIMKLTVDQIEKMIPELSEKVGRELNLWTKGGHARLYVNRNRHKSYGYIDLNAWKVVGYGNQVSVTETFELLNALQKMQTSKKNERSNRASN